MKPVLTLILCALWLIAPAQAPTKTEILDSYSDKVRPLFSTKAAYFKMSLVRTTDSLSTSTVAIIEIKNESSEAVATSTGYAFGSGGGWAVGASETRQLKRESGKRVFGLKELNLLIDRFNQLIYLTGDEKPDVETLWRYDIDEGLSIALSFVPKYGEERVRQYSYIIAIDDAAYEIEGSNNVTMLKKLASFRKIMSN